MCFPQMQAAADKMLVHHSTNPNKSFAVLTLKASQYRISQTRGDGLIVISEGGAVTLTQRASRTISEYGNMINIPKSIP